MGGLAGPSLSKLCTDLALRLEAAADLVQGGHGGLFTIRSVDMHLQRSPFNLEQRLQSPSSRPIFLHRRSQSAHKCRVAERLIDDRGLTTAERPQPFFDEQETSSTVPNEYIRPRVPTYSPPSVVDLTTLRPRPEWYPAWMRYKRREGNYVFWQDKFSRCSIDVPDIEKRWTLFSTIWFSVMEIKFFFFPPALRYLWFLTWRGIMNKAYEAHKWVVASQCKLDSYLADKATGGKVKTFSREMALRRLHWKNCILGELLYLIHVQKTGDVDRLPPVKRPFQRPTFFWLF